MRRDLPIILSLILSVACGPANSGKSDGGGSPPVPPTLACSPANGATGVPVTLAAITVTSNEALLPSSVTATGIVLSDSSNQTVTVKPTLSADGLTLSIGLPSAGLGGNTVYSLYVNGLATANGDMEQASPLETTFTTAGAAPAVMAETPGNTANGVGVDVQPTVTFTEAVTDTNPSSISMVAMLGTPPMSSPVTATVTIGSGGRVASIVPTGATCQDGLLHMTLCEGTLYSIVIGPGLKNAAGVGFAGAPVTVTSFTTEEIPPAVNMVTPSDTATGVTASTKPTILFTHVMNPATVNSSPSSIPTITLQDSTLSMAVSATVSLGTDGMTATVSTTNPLTLGDSFLLTVTTGVEDYSNIAVVMDTTYRFSTGAATPTVVSITPANMATNVLSTVQIIVEFSEDVTGVTTSTFTLTQGTTLVTGTSVIPGNTPTSATLVVPQLMFSTAYTVNLTSGITSMGTPPIALTPFTSSFTTGTN